ncbi:lactonase family protein [Paenibacillus sp. MMS20-IR301]|uniref:lactonase family protein n=1 Tax=Paenibacillus sp. MMS20-IR301 TaxID=2895946 RepID=UPI0028F0248C|nr:lactonase family protein [Paenibacillus sp. MMS20-IR301]WNS45705.1 lactonase family protein [Paenibacillus sp. MMS20-IR301]
MNKNTKLLLFTGSYATAEESGVQVFAFDGAAGGTLERLDTAEGITNPTFVNVDPSGLKLYAIGEKPNGAGGKEGEVITFAIEPETGKLTELSRIPTMSAAGTAQATTCHINRDADHKHIVVCSYHGGTVGLLALDEAGLPVALTDTAVHTGHSVRPGQDKPHPHSAIFSPDETFLFVSDLGLDLIRSYRIHEETGKFEVIGDTKLHEGAGPRHFVFHPDGKSAYVINELDSSVTSFKYDADTGALQTAYTISTLPDDYPADKNGCAEIAFSKDGKYLYGSNRGHDSIVVYAVNPETAELTVVQHESTRGGHPRHFTVTPDGAYLIVANRDGNNLVVFSLDAASGLLNFTGNTAELSKPVCVRPAAFLQ